MQFFECTTNYLRAKRITKGTRLEIQSGPSDWYGQLIDNGLAEGNFALQNSPSVHKGNLISCWESEKAWHSLGKPYYKVFPHMATMMSEVSIDIPAHEIRLPYPVFAVLMPDDSQNDFYEGNQKLRLKWLTVAEVQVDGVDEKKFSNPRVVTRTRFESGASRALWLNYEMEGEWRGNPNQFNYMLSLREEEGSLEDFFERSYKQSTAEIDLDVQVGEYAPSREMILRIVKLGVATAFFGIDKHEVILPDLPRRKIEQRIRKFGNQASALQDIREQHESTRHWTIGREISLPLPLVEKKQVETNDRGQLTHGYLRRGFMRWQVVGEGRKQRKLIFVHPHLVRPDLPMGTSHGFKITG